MMEIELTPEVFEGIHLELAEEIWMNSQYLSYPESALRATEAMYAAGFTIKDMT